MRPSWEVEWRKLDLKARAQKRTKLATIIPETLAKKSNGTSILVAMDWVLEVLKVTEFSEVTSLRNLKSLAKLLPTAESVSFRSAVALVII